VTFFVFPTTIPFEFSSAITLKNNILEKMSFLGTFFASLVLTFTSDSSGKDAEMV